jgi:hypothetical protein
MKTIIALLTVAFVCSVVVTVTWAVKNYIRSINEEKRRLKNCQRSLAHTDKK